MREQIHGEAGPVHIPGYLLPVRLSTLAISYRLLVALRRLRRSFIGDLDGLSSKYLIDVDARGSDLMTELIDLIQRIPAAPQHCDSSSTDPPAKSRLQIPRCTPRRFHYRSRQLARPSCNAGSPSENRRLTIQPLTPIPKFPGDVSKALNLLDQRLARFIPRDLAIIKLRYGGDAKPPATLLDICRNFTLTPEGVRHILHGRLTQLRQSPEIRAAAEQLASFCHQHQCILTPALLAQWLPSPPVGRSVPAEPPPSPLWGLESLGKRRKEFARGKGPSRGRASGASESLGKGEVNAHQPDLAFLLRLLSELNPNLPTWPSAKTLH